MGLAEKLASRASARGATAQVDCGELGTVTVEALPLRELELLSRGPDGARKVFYAACRELQAAGEEMRRAGKVYTPDEVLQFVSDREADAAFARVAALSGTNSEKLSEVRLSSVQEKSGATGEIRPSSVQETTEPEPEDGAAAVENRSETVQVDSGDGTLSEQVSRETGTEFEGFLKIRESDNKTPSMGELLPEETQNAGAEENFVEAFDERRSRTAAVLHESKSEQAGASHEMKSDRGDASRLGLHETESESGGKRPSALHEIESESPEMLHETESEVVECAARALLAGLQRAKWVRGG